MKPTPIATPVKALEAIDLQNKDDKAISEPIHKQDNGLKVGIPLSPEIKKLKV